MFPQHGVACPAVFLQFVERVHESRVQPMHGNIGADAGLTFGHESSFAAFGQQTVDHADIMVVKHQSTAGEHLQTGQSGQCAQIVLQEMVHTVG